MIAKLSQVGKYYQVGDQRITALEPTDMVLNEGELLLIIGPSGSGKTTLLSLLGCVLYPSVGKLVVDGNEVNNLNEKELAKLRLHKIGFVFQNFNLLAPLSAEDNVLMPLKLQGIKQVDAKKRVEKALELVDMTDRRKNLPKQTNILRLPIWTLCAVGTVLRGLKILRRLGRLINNTHTTSERERAHAHVKRKDEIRPRAPREAGLGVAENRSRL